PMAAEQPARCAWRGGARQRAARGIGQVAGRGEVAGQHLAFVVLPTQAEVEAPALVELDIVEQVEGPAGPLVVLRAGREEAGGGVWCAAAALDEVPRADIDVVRGGDVHRRKRRRRAVGVSKQAA